jgi:hypothetical protein
MRIQWENNCTRTKVIARALPPSPARYCSRKSGETVRKSSSRRRPWPLASVNHQSCSLQHAQMVIDGVCGSVEGGGKLGHGNRSYLGKDVNDFLTPRRHKCGQLFLSSNDMKSTVPAHRRDRNTLLKLIQ